MLTLKHRVVLDPRTGDYSNVTDIITEQGASRVLGHVNAGYAAMLLNNARRVMK